MVFIHVHAIIPDLQNCHNLWGIFQQIYRQHKQGNIQIYLQENKSVKKGEKISKEQPKSVSQRKADNTIIKRQTLHGEPIQTHKYHKVSSGFPKIQ